MNGVKVSWLCCAGMALYLSCCLLLSLLCSPVCQCHWPPGGLHPKNEVLLYPSPVLPEGRITSVQLKRNSPKRWYFAVQEARSPYSITVTPCDVPIEWRLSAKTLLAKPVSTIHLESKKSKTEQYWRTSEAVVDLFIYSGNSAETFTGHFSSKTLYTIMLLSTERDTQVTMYLTTRDRPRGLIPELPLDPRVDTVGVGMTSVTISWEPSPSVLQQRQQQDFHYCLLVNRWHNYKSLCAAETAMKKKEVEKPSSMGSWWWHGSSEISTNLHPGQHTALKSSDDKSSAITGVCTGTENIYTFSDLLPETQYYFDVFVVNRLNQTSSTYTGTIAHTLPEPQPEVVQLIDGEIIRVDLKGRRPQQQYSFRPKSWQRSALFTFQTCTRGQVRVKITSKGRTLASQVVDGLGRILLEGKPKYVLQLEPASKSGASLKIQASTAYHKPAFPLLPEILNVKSFSKLRTCNSVTLAWLGTQERSKYCVYRKRIAETQLQQVKKKKDDDRCSGPESRRKAEKVLCKYFQELNPLRAVTTTTVAGLEPGTSYLFDVYLIGQWGFPIKYRSKVVRTRKAC
ncbi:protein NDNF-like [Huso huso]|uniref:Protein NDNF n=1 Tax=Huso huso TaxID=61971 RepID=A0ABR0ZRD9_HUSHU